MQTTRSTLMGSSFPSSLPQAGQSSYLTWRCADCVPGVDMYGARKKGSQTLCEILRSEFERCNSIEGLQRCSTNIAATLAEANCEPGSRGTAGRFAAAGRLAPSFRTVLLRSAALRDKNTCLEVLSKEVQRRMWAFQEEDEDNSSCTSQVEEDHQEELVAQTQNVRRQSADTGSSGRRKSGKRKAGDSLIPLFKAYDPEVDSFIDGTGHSDKSLSARAERENAWLATFRKMSDDNRLYREDNCKALDVAGFLCIKADWVEETWSSITHFNGVGPDEFLRLCSLYEERLRAAIAGEFQARDRDGNGCLDEGMLPSILNEFGMQPMAHVLREIVAELNIASSEMDFANFEGVLSVLYMREGFSTTEHAELAASFGRFDRNGNGDLDTQELYKLLAWLGYPVKLEDIAAVVCEVDVDNSGHICLREFLQYMRRIRNHNLDRLREAIDNSDSNSSGSNGSSELMALMKVLGYNADPIAVTEAAHVVGLDIRTKTGDFDLGDLWGLCEAYRSREGLTCSMANEVTEAFRRYDRDGSEEIDVTEIGKVLRWLGLQVPFDVQQLLASQVDVDNSGRLNLRELQKMVRMYRESSNMAVQAAFQKYDYNLEGLLSLDKARGAFRELGHRRTEMLPAFRDEDMAQGKVNIFGFTMAVARHRAEMQHRFRQSGGYAAQEVEQLRAEFDKYDLDSSGDISNTEFLLLIEGMFPDMANNPDLRVKLQALTKEVDPNNDGRLDFHDFIPMMRQFHDLEENEIIAKEQKAEAETGFNAQEIQEFRQLFLEIGQQATKLSLGETKKMISTICPLGDKNTAEFTALFRKVAGHHADFPDFLRLMRSLLDMDFAQIKERASLVC